MSTNQAKTAAAKKNERAAFEATKLDAAQKNIHVFAGIISICNFLFLICDLFFIQAQSGRMVVGIARYCFSILLIVVVRTLQRIKTYAAFSAAVSALEATSILLFFAVLWFYEEPNFLIHTMGMLLTVLVVFIIPNRSANMLVLSLTATTAFFLFFLFIKGNIPAGELIAAAAYAALTIVLCALRAFSAENYAQSQFITRSRLELATTRDFLTNAATRERLEEEARRWMNFCRRQGLPLCLVFVDVDDLKRINDQYGHAMGDVALKEVAKLMQTQLRNSDTIARWGGDEFVLLLPNVTLQNAVLLLDRVKNAVCQITLEGGISISCSFGVVQMGSDSTYAQLLSEADTMMYRAKQGGKSRISYPKQGAAEIDLASGNF